MSPLLCVFLTTAADIEPGVSQQHQHAAHAAGRGRVCGAVQTPYPSAKPPPAPTGAAAQSGPEELSSVYYEKGGVNVKAVKEGDGERGEEVDLGGGVEGTAAAVVQTSTCACIWVILSCRGQHV